MSKVVVVNSAKEVFGWIEQNGGDDILAGKDWHPAPWRRDDDEHIYLIDLVDGSEVEFDAPNANLAEKIWNDTF